MGYTRFRLLFEVGYKSTLKVEGMNLDSEHILDNGEPFNVSFFNAQEAAEWIAKYTDHLNENMHYGYYYINVLNWIKEEV